MFASLPKPKGRIPLSAGVFANILCAVDGTPGTAAVLSKAQILAGTAGHVSTFDLTEETEAALLMDAADGYDLLVVGGTKRSRAAGFLSGSATSYAVHAARVPVLVARPQPSIRFPGIVLAATAGAQDDETVRLAARIAAEFGGSAILAHAGKGSDHEVRHALGVQSAIAKETTGTEPVVLSVAGDPASQLSTMAVTTAAGLIVVGSSGREGLSTVASVSERVAHRAPCSVLIARNLKPGDNHDA